MINSRSGYEGCHTVGLVETRVEEVRASEIVSDDDSQASNNLS